jgi:hypothetical protein
VKVLWPVEYGRYGEITALVLPLSPDGLALGPSSS